MKRICHFKTQIVFFFGFDDILCYFDREYFLFFSLVFLPTIVYNFILKVKLFFFFLLLIVLLFFFFFF